MKALISRLTVLDKVSYVLCLLVFILDGLCMSKRGFLCVLFRVLCFHRHKQILDICVVGCCKIKIADVSAVKLYYYGSKQQKKVRIIRAPGSSYFAAPYDAKKKFLSWFWFSFFLLPYRLQFFWGISYQLTEFMKAVRGGLFGVQKRVI